MLRISPAEAFGCLSQVPDDPQHDTGWGFYAFELCHRMRGHFDMT